MRRIGSDEDAKAPQDRDDHLHAFLHADVIGPVYWDAIHRCESVAELVALTRLFPCCKCRGNFRHHEATLSGKRKPLSTEEALEFWSSNDMGPSLLERTVRLHAHVNAALGKTATLPTVETVALRVQLTPLSAATVETILISALASLCQSDNQYDTRARQICDTDHVPLQARCNGAALVYCERATALASYARLVLEQRVTLQRSDPTWLRVAELAQRFVQAGADPDRDAMQLVTAWAAATSELARQPLADILRSRCSSA